MLNKMKQEDIEKEIKKGRNFLKAERWGGSLESDQSKGKPAPPVQKPYPEDEQLIDLVPAKEFSLGEKSLQMAMENRRSRRNFGQKSFTHEEFSFLVWAVQGLNSTREYFRTAPSAGARHPFETYILINKVEVIKKGLYRYLPLEHSLLLLEEGDLREEYAGACLSQNFTRKSAVSFIWTALPYRTEWRYSVVSHKVIALDAGHVCQNLYLAAEAVGGGACAIGAYSQEKIDELLGVDGEDEFAIYAAIAGKKKN